MNTILIFDKKAGPKFPYVLMKFPLGLGRVNCYKRPDFDNKFVRK